MANTNNAATVKTDAIIVDQNTVSADTDKIWKGVITYGRKTTAGYPVKTVKDGKTVGMLKPTSRKVADTSGAMRATYACSLNPDMPDMLWRHCLVWLAARHAGVTLPESAAGASGS